MKHMMLGRVLLQLDNVWNPLKRFLIMSLLKLFNYVPAWKGNSSEKKKMTL